MVVWQLGEGVMGDPVDKLVPVVYELDSPSLVLGDVQDVNSYPINQLGTMHMRIGLRNP